MITTKSPRGDGEIAGIVVLAILGLAAWGGYSLFTNTSLFSGNIPGSDLTVYPVWCDNTGATSFQNCTNPYAYDRVAYKLDASNNQVVSWSPDDAQSGLTKNTDCTIVNTSNWSCNSDTYGLGFGVTNGQYYDQSMIKTIYVTKAQWDGINNGAPSPLDAGTSATSTASTDTTSSATDSSGSDTSTDTDTTQNYPKGKCVTESGVQICDLSYNVTNVSGVTRTIMMPGNEIICEDLTNDQSSDIQSDTTTINSDSQFCATDLGAVYIDPSINVAKYYGDITTSDGNYSVPSNDSPCIWTWSGGNGDIPFISLIPPSALDADSGYNVHAFCQDGANEVDIYSQSDQ